MTRTAAPYTAHHFILCCLSWCIKPCAVFLLFLMPCVLLFQGQGRLVSRPHHCSLPWERCTCASCADMLWSATPAWCCTCRITQARNHTSVPTVHEPLNTQGTFIATHSPIGTKGRSTASLATVAVKHSTNYCTICANTSRQSSRAENKEVIERESALSYTKNIYW